MNYLSYVFTETITTSPMRSKPPMLITKEVARLEMLYLRWTIGVSYISVKFKCEDEIK